jgi:hypothetical protein
MESLLLVLRTLTGLGPALHTLQRKLAAVVAVVATLVLASGGWGPGEEPVL